MNEQKLTIIDTFTEKEKLNSLDQQIVHLLLTQPTITDTELATKLGVSRQTINKRRNSEVVRERLSKVLSISEKRIRRLVALSLDQLEVFLSDPDPKLRMMSALSILKLGSTMITATPNLFGMRPDDHSEEWNEDET